MNNLINRLHSENEKKTIEIKLNKKTFFNILILLIVLFAVLQLVELGLVAHALKTGAFCK